ncbi:MAG: AMP-binding protein, partial [Bacteroidales bacterium]|nr:AMP-binding protein [Bacteroidales bacterium]
MKTIKDFIDYLEQLARTDADRVAIVDRDGSRETTYGELWKVVCRIAEAIGERQKNAEGCRFIPICLSDSMEYLASDYAIWMSGNAAVHMGKSFPQERIDYIMGHCEAEFMIDEAFIAEAMGRDV